MIENKKYGSTRIGASITAGEMFAASKVFEKEPTSEKQLGESEESDENDDRRKHPRAEMDSDLANQPPRNLVEQVDQAECHRTPWRVLVVDDEDIWLPVPVCGRQDQSLKIARRVRARRIESNVRDTPTIRVLVVDDEEAVRCGLEDWLSRRGFSVVTAHDLRSATNAIVAHRYDVILLDVRLGPENGLRLVELLRSLQIEIPCVVLTGHAGPNDGFKAHELGVAFLIEKPSSPDEIASVLRHIVEESKRHPAVLVGDTKSSGLHRDRNGHVADATKWIHENFKTKGLSVDLLARSIGVSSGHLGAIFRREMGCPILEYIHRCRVVHATRLLKTTDASVKVIADDCGYHGSAELHRHFTRHVGKSPMGFRSAN